MASTSLVYETEYVSGDVRLLIRKNGVGRFIIARLTIGVANGEMTLNESQLSSLRDVFEETVRAKDARDHRG